MSKSNALYMDELETAQENVENLSYALKLALEYWSHRQQRYKNRSPVWVQEARRMLDLVDQP
jgi:hypothetical protein